MGSVSVAVPPIHELRKRRTQKWHGWPEDVLVSTVAEMDFDLAEPIADALSFAIRRGELGYAPPATDSFRQAFCGFASARLKWTVDPGQVELIPDVMTGLLAVAELAAGATRRLAFVAPVYPPFRLEPRLAGFDVRELPLLSLHGIDIDILSAELDRGTRVVVLANPHNPTGRNFERAELEAIAEECAARDAWVIADEVHGPLTMPGAEHVPWLEVSEAARYCGVSLTSASKAFNIGGLKAALLVTASNRARQLATRLPPLFERASIFGVIASEAAFVHGGDWLDAVLLQLTSNRRLLSDLIPRLLPGITWTPPQASFLAWLDCAAVIPGRDPALFALEHGRLAVISGAEFGDSGVGHVRLNFGTSGELLDAMVQRLSTAVQAAARGLQGDEG